VPLCVKVLFSSSLQTASIPKFQLLKVLGRGACATVYVGVDLDTMCDLKQLASWPHSCRAPIAVKVVSDPHHHKAAIYEHHLTQTLSHPNVLVSHRWSVALVTTVGR
jgi:serine/threonine protein kinase